MSSRYESQPLVTADEPPFAGHGSDLVGQTRGNSLFAKRVG